MPDTRRRAVRIDWGEERERYVTGTESFTDVARRLGVSKSAVEQHAAKANLGQTWGESRAKYRSERYANVRKDVGENQAELLKLIDLRRVQLAITALDRIAEVLSGDLKVRELVDIAKLGIDQKLQISAGKPPDTEIAIPMTLEEHARMRPFLDAALGRPLSSMTPEDRAVLRSFIEGDDQNVSHGSDQVR